ncbi:MAG: nucleotidyltransferase, partial [Elusimicrobiota bacterium]|nr:nucleotidyltransferase [Elusimicrobiota bacterium]
EAGGIHVRQSPFDGKVIDIKFFNAKGRDISLKQEKSIEQLFYREDFKRADLNDIGEIIVPPRAVDYYRTGYLNTIKKDIIQNSHQKLVIDYANSSASMIFPAILGELGIDVVALNAFVTSSGSKTTSTDDFQNSLSQLSNIVTTLDSSAGFLIDSGAEKLFFVDEKGKVLHNDLSMFVAAYLAMKTNSIKNVSIAVPVYASSAIEVLAKKFKVKVKRTGTSPRNIMDVASEENIIFVGDSQGGFIFPQFQAAFDAMFAIGKIVEMLAEVKMPLSAVAKQIPPLCVLHKAVACSWDKKGQTMRNAIEHSKHKKSELIDGVKIYLSDSSWVLLVPDPDDTFFHVWAEAKKMASAKTIIDTYEKKVKEWQA